MTIDRTVEYRAVRCLPRLHAWSAGLQIVNRFVFRLPLSWSEELQRFVHIWIVILAVPVAYRRGAHIGMNMLPTACPACSAARLLQELLWLVLALAIGRYSRAS